MLSKRVIWSGFGLASILVVVGVTVAASGFNRGNERADCPGKIKCPLTGELVCKDQCPLTDPDRPACPDKIECPLTGELVCKDQCPLTDADRPDCPGKIKCPLTGEMVCKDQCPLGSDTDESASGEALPTCCAGKQ